MEDWPNIIIPAVSGLIGAGVGGYATWKAAGRTGAEERALAAEERTKDAEERKAMETRAAALSARAVIVVAQTNLYNLERLRLEDAGGRLGERGNEIREAAVGASDSMRQLVLVGGYLLPDQVQDRIQHLYQLVNQATYMDMKQMDQDSQRVGADVQTYGRWTLMSVEAVIKGTALPEDVDPPNLLRGGTTPLMPDPLPIDW